MTFSNKPILLFWETTRACPLRCVHCRADAIENPLPGELSTAEGRNLIDQVAAFGKPYPVIIFTGGDPLKRDDLYELLAYASSKGIGFAVSPAVSQFLTIEVLEKLKRSGAASISVSLDGAQKEIHDSIRQLNGTYERTISVMRQAIGIGLPVQVNTTVMKQNVTELPMMFKQLMELGIKVWEVFFLIKAGRGKGVDDLTPSECESVCNFLYDVSKCGIIVRTVEAPFIRRVAKRRERTDYWAEDELYLKMRSELDAFGYRPVAPSTIKPVGTLDGDGIMFVSYDGTVSPGGFLPLGVGNVKNGNIVDVYTKNELFMDIRERRLEGPCGTCAFKSECGGSRARAYAYSGNPLGSDSACFYMHSLKNGAKDK